MKMTLLSPSDFVVTTGALNPLQGSRIGIDQPQVRSHLTGTHPQIFQVDFDYEGPTATEIPLGSGDIARQVVVYMRYANICNNVTAQWRFFRTNQQPSFVVQVKRNPGQDQSTECGNQGYTTVAPLFVDNELAVVNPGDRKRMLVEIVEDLLTIHAGQSQVWRGQLPPTAFEFSGPPGLRSDNASLAMQLRVGS